MKVILLRRRHRRMGIGRADQSELVGIYTSTALKRQATAQRRADVVALLSLIGCGLPLYVERIGLKLGKRVIR